MGRRRAAGAQRNLLQEFHDERSGGDKAFKLLERLGAGRGDAMPTCSSCSTSASRSASRAATAPAQRPRPARRIAARVLDGCGPGGAARGMGAHAVARWAGEPRAASRRWHWCRCGSRWWSVRRWCWACADVDVDADRAARPQPVLQQLHDMHRRTAPPRRRPRRAAKRALAPLLGRDLDTGALDGARRGAALGGHARPPTRCSCPAPRSSRPANASCWRASRRRSPACPGAVEVIGHTDDAAGASRCSSRRTGTCRASARRRWPRRWPRQGVPAPTAARRRPRRCRAAVPNEQPRRARATGASRSSCCLPRPDE